jgi:hypothetical protein
MLRLCTDVVGFEAPRALALYIKRVIEGHAYGCVEAYRSWNLPQLYQSGTRFAYEPQHGNGLEMFDLPLTTFRRGWGDCDDLVIWRICELVARGEKATCKTAYRNNALHVQVRRADGSVEDPSVILGAPLR